MRPHRSVVFALVAYALGAWPAGAQEAKGAEVTPYVVAFGSNLGRPVGAAVTVPLTSRFSVETDVAHRRVEGHLHALSSNASLLALLPPVGYATPYVAAGAGFSQYGAPVFGSSGGLPIGTARSGAMTVSAGGGLKVPLSERVDLRTDVRVFRSSGYQRTRYFGGLRSEWFRVALGVSFDLGKR